GNWTVTATDATDGTKTSYTSPSITVKAGTLAKLQVLTPGETAAPGSSSGKTGTPMAQTAGTAFTVTVNSVDANWNLISTNDTVERKGVVARKCSTAGRHSDLQRHSQDRRQQHSDRQRRHSRWHHCQH